MMKRRKKKKRTFKPFGNPGRKLRTNVITSAPPMAIADRAPGMLCSLSVCYSVCSCARLGDSGGRVYLKTFRKRRTLSPYYEKYSQNEKIFHASRDWICVSREIFPSEKAWYWCRKQQANTTIKRRVVCSFFTRLGKRNASFSWLCLFCPQRERRIHTRI